MPATAGVERRSAVRWTPPTSDTANLPQYSGDPSVSDRIAHRSPFLVTRAFRPTFPSGATRYLTPTGGTEGSARFVGLRIRDASAVAHRLGRPPDRAVKHRIGIARAIGARPIDLERYAVVIVTSNRPARTSDPDKGFAVVNGNGKFMAARRFVMPMMFGNECACGSEGYGAYFQHGQPFRPFHLAHFCRRSRSRSAS